MGKITKDDFSKMDLEELVNQLNNAMEIAHLGMYEWDVENDIVNFNEQGYIIAGISPEDFNHNMSFIIQNILHKDSKEDFINAIKAVKNNKAIANNVYRLNRPDGKEYWIEFKSRIICQNGQVVKLVGVIMDVTERVINTRHLEENVNFIKMLIENIPSPIFYKDVQGLYRHFNRYFEKFLGLEKEEILGKTVYDVAPDELAKVYDKADKELMESKGKQVYESFIEDADGNRRNVIFRKSAHLNEKGDIEGLIGLIQDVTPLRKAEEELKRIYKAQETLMKFNQTIMSYDNEKSFLHDILTDFMRVFEQVATGILLEVDEEGIVSLYDSHGLAVIDKAAAMKYEDSYIYKITRGEHNKIHVLNEIDFSEFPSDDPGLEIVKNNPLKSNIFIPILYEGEIKWFFVYAAVDKGAFDEEDCILAEYIRTEMDVIIKTFKLLQKTLQMARYDGVTGLMNRVYFDESIRALMEAKRCSSCHIVLIDVDDLKLINDVLGHDKGDYYLSYIGSLSRKFFSVDTMWGRIGGDEFAAAIPEIPREELEKRMEEMRIAYERHIFENTDGEIKSSFSYGIATSQRDGNTYKELLKAADKRMYIYKHFHKKNKI